MFWKRVPLLGWFSHVISSTPQDNQHAWISQALCLFLGWFICFPNLDSDLKSILAVSKVV